MLIKRITLATALLISWSARQKPMEPDRYQHNQNLYIIGLVFLLLSLSVFAFSLYLLPFLLFKWRYDIPEFIIHWHHALITRNFSDTAASWLIFLGFLIFAVLCASVARTASTRIENEIYEVEPEVKPEPARVRDESREITSLLFKIALIVIGVFLGALFLHWLISTPPPNPIP